MSGPSITATRMSSTPSEQAQPPQEELLELELLELELELELSGLAGFMIFVISRPASSYSIRMTMPAGSVIVS